MHQAVADGALGQAVAAGDVGDGQHGQSLNFDAISQSSAAFMQSMPSL